MAHLIYAKGPHTDLMLQFISDFNGSFLQPKHQVAVSEKQFVFLSLISQSERFLVIICYLCIGEFAFVSILISYILVCDH